MRRDATRISTKSAGCSGTRAMKKHANTSRVEVHYARALRARGDASAAAWISAACVRRAVVVIGQAFTLSGGYGCGGEPN